GAGATARSRSATSGATVLTRPRRKDPQTIALMTLPDPLALPPGYQQRNWSAQDIDAVVALDALIFGPDRWSAQIFGAEFAASNRSNPHSYYQIITYHDTVVGFCGLAYGPPFADITTIGIHPDHTGKRLGAVLLNWLIRTAYTLGV